MTERYSYACEKLGNAVRILATGPGDVRSRLVSAFMEFHTLKESNLPPELHKDLQWILKKLTIKPPSHKYEGSIHASTRAMKNKTGVNIACKILEMESIVRRQTIR